MLGQGQTRQPARGYIRKGRRAPFNVSGIRCYDGGWCSDKRVNEKFASNQRTTSAALLVTIPRLFHHPSSPFLLPSPSPHPHLLRQLASPPVRALQDLVEVCRCWPQRASREFPSSSRVPFQPGWSLRSPQRPNGPGIRAATPAVPTTLLHLTPLCLVRCRHARAVLPGCASCILGSTLPWFVSTLLETGFDFSNGSRR
jgi:hypothetical protein